MFNLAAAVSLALFIATVIVWPRSYWTWYDIMYFGGDRRSYSACCYRGGVYLWSEPCTGTAGFYHHSLPADADPLLDAQPFQLAGVGYARLQAALGMQLVLVRVPDWLLLVLFGGAAWLSAVASDGAPNRAGARPAATTSAPRPNAVRSAGWKLRRNLRKGRLCEGRCRVTAARGVNLLSAE
jgi:hypothetical protein